jgi:P4 family phage/plasmid primase-like protien
MPPFEQTQGTPNPDNGQGHDAPVGEGVGDDAGGSGRVLQLLRPRRCADIDRACASFPLTDLGNAERFVRRYGDDFRFCAELGWFRWDTRRWVLLSEERDRLPALVMQAVFLTVRAIKNEAFLVRESGVHNSNSADDADAPDKDAMDHVIDAKKGILYSDKIAEWARTSEGAGRINCIAALAKVFENIAVDVIGFDADRMAINCQNGTLRIERASRKRDPSEIAAGKSEWHSVWTVKLKPHDRRDMITKIAAVTYKPKARSPVYDAFMETVQPDPAMRRFIAQWGGLSLTGNIGEQKLAFFYGQGRNGKGTWVEAIAYVAGDYAGSLPIESLLDNGKRRGDQATPDIARLPGVRFLRVSEPSKGAVLNEGLVKMVTGGDPVDARHLNKGLFTFLPEFKMTISGNNKPAIKDTSDGIWRRMQLVPWAIKIADADVDRRLGDKLQDEGSGIFARLIEGLLDWSVNGLIEPDAVRMATSEYRDDSDDLGRFLRECSIIGEDLPSRPFRVRKTDLFALFGAWAVQTGSYERTSRQFSKAMQAKGFKEKHSDGSWWLGVMGVVQVDDVKAGIWTAADEKSGASRGVDINENSDLDDFI